MTPSEEMILKIAVTERAKQLRKDGVGYGAALNQLADEYYRQFVLGEDTPLGHVAQQKAASIGDVDWNKVVSAGAAIIGVIGKIGAAIWHVIENKKKKIEEIKTRITPWVADAYAGNA